MANRAYSPVDETTTDDIESAVYNTFPRGEIAHKIRYARSETTDGVNGAVSCSPNVTDDRQLQVFAQASLRNTEVGGGAQARLHIDAVVVQRKNMTARKARTDMSITVLLSVQLATGVHSFALVTGLAGSDGLVTMWAGDTHGSALLVVNDVGSAYS